MGCGHHGARGWQGRGVARDARFAKGRKAAARRAPRGGPLRRRAHAAVRGMFPAGRGGVRVVSEREAVRAMRRGRGGDAPRVRVPRVDPAPGRRGRAEFGALGLASVASRTRGASAGARRRRRRRRERRLRRGRGRSSRGGRGGGRRRHRRRLRLPRGTHERHGRRRRRRTPRRRGGHHRGGCQAMQISRRHRVQGVAR